MKLNIGLVHALAKAAERLGSAAELGKKSGIDPASISRYLNGKVRSLSDDNWNKLEKVMNGKELLPEFSSCQAVIEWHEVEKDPDLIINNSCREVALRVKGAQMEPGICDRDVIVVRKTADLDSVPENKIVLAVCRKAGLLTYALICKRLRKIGGRLWFFSDSPEGKFFPAEKENILWTGVVLRKICEL
ncbi:MAG: helix-turn-helix domain-containing protein [Lentisphaeria bacterium]|nr:helix-turn-helix domain-containing protein [Lentisphaeria bacterium]